MPAIKSKGERVVWRKGDERLRGWIGSAGAVPPFLARRCEGIGLHKGRSPLRREFDDVRQGVEKGRQVYLLKICQKETCAMTEEILLHGKPVFDPSNKVGQGERVRG